jgi:uncharacterized protein (DUF362 family)
MTQPEIEMNTGRRTFLKLLSFLGISGAIHPKKILSKFYKNNSRVIIVTDTQATSGTTINTSVVQIMVNSAIKSLAQNDDIGEAWKLLLPGITSASRIAIKVNCINSSVPTHPAVTNAVVNTLKQMLFSGNPFNENNIIIFDRTQSELQSSGYAINTGTTGVRCMGTNSTGAGYTTQTYNVNGSSQKLSKIVVDMCDYLINISVLKNHSLAGVTLCLKNHYGTCNNPGNLHGGYYCDPYIPALNALDAIKLKQRVNIIDALYGIKSGGPGGSAQFVANKLIMSTDIVACDYWGRKTLLDNGCTTTAYATHVDTASTTYQLGTNNPAQMDVVNIQNPSAKAVTLLIPNGGENWKVGDKKKITWNSQNINDLKIDFSYDNGVNWSTIVNSISANLKEYEWTIPNNPSTQCKIRISDVTNASIKDESDNVFAISLTPALAITSPNGGELWEVNSKQDIKWNFVNVNSIKIEFSIDNGINWIVIAESAPAQAGIYNWTIPNTPSSLAKVRITDNSNVNLKDESDSVFTISPLSSIKDKLTQEGFELYQGYPNPFNSQSKIRFRLPKNSFVELEILDASGKTIDSLVYGNKSMGMHSVIFNANSISSGVYFVRLKSGQINLLQKIVLVK